MCAYECLLLLDDKLDVGVGSTLSHANMRATLLSTFSMGQMQIRSTSKLHRPTPTVMGWVTVYYIAAMHTWTQRSHKEMIIRIQDDLIVMAHKCLKMIRSENQIEEKEWRIIFMMYNGEWPFESWYVTQSFKHSRC